MTKQQKITFSASRDIPFKKLMLSQSNVRQEKAGVLIEELAEDIARRTLLSFITVRPVLNESGAETSLYTIPAGGWRFRALDEIFGSYNCAHSLKDCSFRIAALGAARSECWLAQIL